MYVFYNILPVKSKLVKFRLTIDFQSNTVYYYRLTAVHIVFNTSNIFLILVSLYKQLKNIFSVN